MIPVDAQCQIQVCLLLRLSSGAFRKASERLLATTMSVCFLSQDGPFDLKTGLHPLEDAQDLYEIDEHYVEEMEERRQLLDRRHAEVFASTTEVMHLAWT